VTGQVSAGGLGVAFLTSSRQTERIRLIKHQLAGTRGRTEPRTHNPGAVRQPGNLSWPQGASLEH
jgi:hypothetical protein